MHTRTLTALIFATALSCAGNGVFAAAADAGPKQDYATRVRTCLDTLVSKGRDRYGKQHSPMFAAILDANTLECPENPPVYEVLPVRMDPGRPWQHSPGAANHFFDQATFLAMDAMTRISGDKKYRRAVLDALNFNLNTAVDHHGFPALGGHTRWNFYKDRIDADSEHHELWYWPMAWELWYEADPQKMKQYAEKMWHWHVVDKETGETNRHSDMQHGWSFTCCDGTMMSIWGFMATKSNDPQEKAKFRAMCQKVSDYHWNRRDPKTGFHPSSGGQYGITKNRYDTKGFNTSNIPWARAMIICGRQTDNQELVSRGRAILDSYARFGYNPKTALFYSQLRLDGTPVDVDSKRDPVSGEYEPVGYLATWMPDTGWHEIPLHTAQAYVWAAENIDRKAYLPTARRFGRILIRAWKERYAGYQTWAEYRHALKPFGLKDVTKPGQTRQLRYNDGAGVDQQLLSRYRNGGYVYQAPYGLFADHYGRMIQFSVSMHRLTTDEQWLSLATEVADDAVKELWRGKIFVGHPSKQHYMAGDQVGILLLALLQLDGALHGCETIIDPYF